MLALENDSGWDRTFLHLSSLAFDPICKLYELFRYRLVQPLDPNEFDNCTTKTREVAIRALIVASTLASAALFVAFPITAAVAAASIAALAISSRIFRIIGFALQRKEGFTHVKGELSPQPFTELHIGTFNICGIPADFPKDHGGVNGWGLRAKVIADIIRNANDHIVILEEVLETRLIEALIEELKGEFADFFYHTGPTKACSANAILGAPGGIAVFSKVALHNFSTAIYNPANWTLNRNFAYLKAMANPEDATSTCAGLFGTHFQFGSDKQAKQMRSEEVAQIVDHLAQETLPLPTVLAGDLNIELNSEEYNQTLAPVLHPGYDGSQGPTCTGRLTAKWHQKEPEPDETIDYISLFKNHHCQGVRIEDYRLYAAYNTTTYSTKTAASDHNYLSAVLRWYDRSGNQITPQQWKAIHATSAVA